MSIQKIPLIALIGIPNSGKSTLLNHLTGKKVVTAMEAHTTRDLNYGEDFWEGMFMRFVDTGGLVPDPKDKIQKEVQIKSWSAISQADLLIWVIDRKTDPDTLSLNIVQRVWQTGKPFIIAINKVDDLKLEASVANYAFLGGDGFVNISCNTGYGFNNLMDLVLENLLKLGFKQNFDREFNFYTKKEKKKKSRLKNVEKSADGDYYIVRNQQGLFESVNKNLFEGKEDEEKKFKKIENLVFDLGGVLIELRYKKMQEFLIQEFNLDKEKQEKLRIFFEEAKINGDKYEKLENWEKLVTDLELL
jgi:small GTP-binding protein